MDHLARAHHYRDEAIHLRQLADKDEDARRRETLLSVANSYDKLYGKYLAMAMPKRP